MSGFWNIKLRVRDFVIIIMAIAIVLLCFQLKDKNTAIEFVNSEKDALTLEYTSLLTDYESLQTDNDTLNTKLIAEQEKIREIIAELDNVKASSAAKIRQYKKELETLRTIMKGFVHDIDSLNTLNQQLIAENTEIKDNYKQATGQINKLTQAKQELEDKVTVGSVIQAKDVGVLLLNDADKVINKDGDVIKAKKVNKIKVNFTLRENPLAKAGVRDVYMRIARPDGLLLTSDDEGFFEYEKQEIAYSAKREADYRNEDIAMSIIWKKSTDLLPGDYAVDIFIDGTRIGLGKFQLK